VEKNFALGNTPPSNLSASSSTFQQTVSDLSRFWPAIGVGGTYHLGPGWYLRLDIGTDMVAVGIALHF
jgi:hypothetical protein